MGKAFYRVQMGVIQRSKGQSARVKSAYQRRLQTEDGSKDFSDSDDLISYDVMLPRGAPAQFKDPDVLWKKVETIEHRMNSQLARSFEVSIDRSVHKEDWVEFAEYMMEFFTEKGFAVEYAIHEADCVTNNKKNAHFHALVTMRTMNEKGFSTHKDRELNAVSKSENGSYFRRIFCERMNEFYKKKGLDSVADYKRLEDRDSIPDRIPQKVISEIKRLKKAYKKHLESGSKEPFKGKLSKSAEDFLSEFNKHKNLQKEIAQLERELAELNRMEEIRISEIMNESVVKPSPFEALADAGKKKKTPPAFDPFSRYEDLKQDAKNSIGSLKNADSRKAFDEDLDLDA